MSHTPGPWEINKRGCIQYQVDDKTGIQIWKPFNEHWPNAEHDRALIAAAPDLLAMLEEARNAISTLRQEAFGMGRDGVTHWYIRDELLANIDAIVAKAKGETDASQHPS